ncbi:MAG: cytochrome c biogenesis protein CcsA [Myxococcales bacterium]|nr:cytochrome c biogenesis protein CcsA [Myxococcales bacterium]
MPPLFPVTLALQAVACTLYVVAVAQPLLRSPLKVARLVLLLAVLSQVLDIGWLCLRGLHPGSSTREAVFFLSWLLVLAYPVLARRRAAPLIGALLLPMAMIMEIVVRLVPGGSDSGHVAHSQQLASVHIFCATIGTALFGLAAATSVVYLLSERHLKRRMLDAAQPRLPLQTLDDWNHQSIAFGLLSFTLTMVTGTYWLSIVLPRPGSLSMGAQIFTLIRQPQYALSFLTWLIFAGLLAGRRVLGLRGRRAAMWTLVGFGMAVSILGVYLLRDLRSSVP